MGKLGYNQGDFGWMELKTAKAKEAVEFYANLFGWEAKGEPMPGYHAFGRGDEMLGGAVSPEDGNHITGWVPYVTVEDIDSVLEKVKQAGGAVLVEPCELPDGSRTAVIAGPEGVPTGVAQYAKAPTE